MSQFSYGSQDMGILPGDQKVPNTSGDWGWLATALGSAGNPGGFVPGDTTLDWLNLALGGDPVAGPILGLLSQEKAQKSAKKAQAQANAANEARYQQILALNTQAQGLAQSQLNETGQLYANRAQDVQQGYGQALNELNAGSAGAQQSIYNNQQRGLGSITSNLTNRGLGNTTAIGNAQRGIYSDTSQQLGTLADQMAQARAGVQERGTNAYAGARGDLGNFMQNRTGFETGLLGQRANAIQNKTDYFNALPLYQALAAGRTGGGSSNSSGGGGILGGIIKGIGGLFGL